MKLHRLSHLSQGLFSQGLLALSIAALAVACNSAQFAGNNKQTNRAGGPNASKPCSATVTTDCNNAIPNAGTGAGSPGAGSSTTPSNGVGGTPDSVSDGKIIASETGDVTLRPVPLLISYTASEGGDGDFKGTFSFVAKKSGRPDVPLVSFSNGSGGASATVNDFCKCDQTNEFDLYINAGANKNLNGWKQEVLAARARPSNASDWEDWLRATRAPASANHVVFLGGFDHVFSILGGGGQCGPFACDSREWNNRDDVMMFFQCKISDCPGGGAATVLKFTGMDN